MVVYAAIRPFVLFPSRWQNKLRCPGRSWCGLCSRIGRRCSCQLRRRLALAYQRHAIICGSRFDACAWWRWCAAHLLCAYACMHVCMYVFVNARARTSTRTLCCRSAIDVRVFACVRRREHAVYCMLVCTHCYADYRTGRGLLNDCKSLLSLLIIFVSILPFTKSAANSLTLHARRRRWWNKEFGLKQIPEFSRICLALAKIQLKFTESIRVHLQMQKLMISMRISSLQLRLD